MGYPLTATSMLAGYRPVMVLSGSIEPTFPVGSAIYYEAASSEQTQEGDPIIFHAGEAGSLATHRVAEKQELSRDFITRGDANKTAGPSPVSYDRVVGRASDVKIPHVGYSVTYGRAPQVTEVMGGTPVIGTSLDFTCPGKRRKEKA